MSNGDELWVVGRSFWQMETDGTWHWTWDLHGVFSSREKAESLCKDQHWLILPVVVDQPLSEVPQECPGMIMPNKTEAEPLRHKRSAKV